MADDFFCICAKCRKRFAYGDAKVKVRKLYNLEIKEKVCPYCESKSFTRVDDICLLGQMAAHHRYTGR